MGLDFQWLEKKNGDDYISLSFNDYCKIETCFSQLKSMTGIEVDPYAYHIRLSPEHCLILIECLKKRTLKEDSTVKELHKMLVQASTNSWWILVEGD